LQLKQLTAAGLVERRIQSRHRFYRARHAALGPLASWLEQLWDDALSRLARQAELDAARRGPAPRRRRTPRRTS
jgi:DNA-binding transcriptional ArsR family regulator